MENDKMIRKTAEDYSKYITNLDLEKKMEPVNKSIDDMLARLEEFETMYNLMQPDVKDFKDLLDSVLDCKPEIDDMCEKIDSVEFLMEHIKCNLDMLEGKIEEAETKMGVDTTSLVTGKVTNILTPLFKKTGEKKTLPSRNMELFKTGDYFK